MPRGYTTRRVNNPQYPLGFSPGLPGVVPPTTPNTIQFLRADSTWSVPPAGTSANPTASIGLSAVNGTATTFMTSDSAPLLSQAIIPTWSGLHTFSAGLSTTSISGGGAAITISPGGSNSLLITGSANVGLDNGVSIFWKNTSASYQAIMGVDSSNDVLINNVAGTNCIELPSAGGMTILSNITIGATGTISTAGTFIVAANATSTPAGGAASTGFFLGSSKIGIYFGSGAPTVSAPQGSIYLRTDGSGTTNRAYINTNGSTTWTAIDTVA